MVHAKQYFADFISYRIPPYIYFETVTNFFFHKKIRLVNLNIFRNWSDASVIAYLIGLSYIIEFHKKELTTKSLSCCLFLFFFLKFGSGLFKAFLRYLLKVL